MAVVNHAKREINAKIIYFGSPGCGKGDLLRFIHQRIKPSLCGSLKTMSAGHDTLLFFEYIPFESSSLNGYRIRFHLYTLTGPVVNPGTWKMTLKGVDGLAFVTSDASQDTPAESLRVVRTMLTGYGRSLDNIPRIWLPRSTKEMSATDADLSASFDSGHIVPCSIESGDGILTSLAQLSQEVLQKLRDEYQPVIEAEVSPLAPDCINVDAFAGSNPDTCSKSSGVVIVPELKIFLTGDSDFRIPVAIQSGDTVQRRVLHLSLHLEEESV